MSINTDVISDQSRYINRVVKRRTLMASIADALRRNLDTLHSSYEREINSLRKDNELLRAELKLLKEKGS